MNTSQYKYRNISWASTIMKGRFMENKCISNTALFLLWSVPIQDIKVSKDMRLKNIDKGCLKTMDCWNHVMQQLSRWLKFHFLLKQLNKHQRIVHSNNPTICESHIWGLALSHLKFNFLPSKLKYRITVILHIEHIIKLLNKPKHNPKGFLVGLLYKLSKIYIFRFG